MKQLTKYISVLLICMLAVTNTAFAQDDSEWQRGKLWLTDGDSLEGMLRLDLNRELLEVNLQTSLRALTARQVQAFVYIDNNDNINRLFYSFYYQVRRNYKAPLFFEMLHENGKMSLLARDKLVTESVPTYDNFSGRTVYYTRIRLVNEFYFRLKNEDIILFKNTQKHLSELLADKEALVKEYIDKKKLSINEKEDLVGILVYYNSL